jgi:hypothetical protein
MKVLVDGELVGFVSRAAAFHTLIASGSRTIEVRLDLASSERLDFECTSSESLEFMVRYSGWPPFKLIRSLIFRQHIIELKQR